MIPIEQNKIENYIADYYRSYFQMDSVYNDWALVNKIQDTTLFVLDELNKQQPTVAAGLFCRKMDGRFCRKKPDTDVRRAGRIDVAGVFCRTREGRGQSRSLH